MSNKLVLDVVLEIPKHSNIKYEYDPNNQGYRVDRILYGANYYPQNYGFIPNTLDYDGDPLDVLIIANSSFQVGTIVPARILGAMDMIDSGETDTKLIAVIDCDPRLEQVQGLSDIPEHLLKEIKDFFLTYKNLQNKKVVITGFQSLSVARNFYDECLQLHQTYHQLSKQEFIRLMKQKYPEKYCQ